MNEKAVIKREIEKTINGVYRLAKIHVLHSVRD